MTDGRVTPALEKKDPPSALEIRLDNMLSSFPIGASQEAVATFENIGPLTVDIIKKRAPEHAPVNVDGIETRFHEWRNQWGDKCEGQVMKNNLKIRNGIVRKVDRGSLWEGQYANDKLHGFLRII